MRSVKRHTSLCVARMILCIMLAVIVSSCNRRPGYVISEKEMVDLMVDLKLADAYANIELTGQDFKTRRETLAEGVIASHNISREQLDSTISWYGKNLDDYAKLCEKVQKELVARQREMTHDVKADNIAQHILWPYPSHSILSPLGNSDGIIVSITNPEMEKGDILKWNFHSSRAPELTGVLGVEYENGMSDAVAISFYDQSSEMTLQTDTGKIVKRIYGTIRSKEPLKTAIFLDSIKLTRTPYDSVEYMQYRSLKRYGVQSRKAAPSTSINLDSDEEGSAPVNPNPNGELMHRFETVTNQQNIQPQQQPANSGQVRQIKRVRSLEEAREGTALKEKTKLRPVKKK